MTYALDTNTLIYFFKGLGRVAETLLDTPPSEIAVPAIVVYELETGIRKSSYPEKRRRQLSALLVTHNTDEFRRVSGLRLIDWYQGEKPNAHDV